MTETLAAIGRKRAAAAGDAAAIAAGDAAAGAAAAGGAAGAGPAGDAGAMLDDYGVRQLLAAAPARLSDLEAGHFPLVLSFDMLLERMDDLLPDPFIAAAACGAAAAGAPPVGLAEFVRDFWPRLDEAARREAGAAALVWAEVASSIKGSAPALAAAGGRLDVEQYVSLASTRRGASLAAPRRAAVYRLFLQYESLKSAARRYDRADRVAHVYRGWRRAAADGIELLPAAARVQFVYVDEVQDCTIAELALLQ